MIDYASMSENDVIALAQNGDQDAMGFLLKSFDALIYTYSKARFRRDLKTVLFEDIYQEARIGFMEAVRKFDPSKGKKLKAYSYMWMMQKVRRFYENHAYSIRIASSFTLKLEKLRKLEQEYQNKGEKPPREEILKIFSSEAAMERFMTLLASSAGSNFELSSALLDTVHHKDQSAHVSVERKDALDAIRKALLTLTRKEAHVLCEQRGISILDFGLNDSDFQNQGLRSSIKKEDKEAIQDRFERALNDLGWSKNEIFDAFEAERV